MNRIVVGEKHNVLVHYAMWMLVQPAYLLLSSATDSNEIFCVQVSDPRSCCLCACHNSKMNFIRQPQVKKSSRMPNLMWMIVLHRIVHLTYLVLSSATLSNSTSAVHNKNKFFVCIFESPIHLFFGPPSMLILGELLIITSYTLRD